MFQFNPTFAILNIVLLTVAFVRIYSVQRTVRDTQIKLLDLLDDLEKSALASSKLLESLLLDKIKDFPEEKLGNLQDSLVENVFIASNKIIQKKVKYHITPAKKLKWVQLARATHNLEMQAMLQEYGLKYDSSTLPKDVRQWYTHVSNHVEFLSSLLPADAILLNYIRDHILVPPAPEHFPYFLDRLGKEKDPQGIAAEILALFENKIGTFVECGALDGEVHSTTLHLERNFGWSGMLIEADPFNFQIMRSRNRKSLLVPACLSATLTPHMSKIEVNKFHWYQRETGLNESGLESIESHIDVHCLPLTSILLAAELTVVDFMSLNLKGNDFEVLKQTVELRQIDVTMFLVKLPKDTKALEAMIYFMVGYGYKVHHSTQKWNEEHIMFVIND